MLVLDTTTALAVATLLVSLVKPFAESVPGIGTTGARHDNLLRILNYAVNLGTLVGLAYLQSGAWPTRSDWGALIVAAFLGAGGAHLIYAFNTQKRKAMFADAVPKPVLRVSRGALMPQAITPDGQTMFNTTAAASPVMTVPPVPTDPAPLPVPIVASTDTAART